MIFILAMVLGVAGTIALSLPTIRLAFHLNATDFSRSEYGAYGAVPRLGGVLLFATAFVSCVIYDGLVAYGRWTRGGRLPLPKDQCLYPGGCAYSDPGSFGRYSWPKSALEIVRPDSDRLPGLVGWSTCRGDNQPFQYYRSAVVGNPVLVSDHDLDAALYQFN